MVPSYLLSGTGCEKGICYGCLEAVQINPATERWFITMGHPGFNSRANNGRGYASKTEARRDLALFARARVVENRRAVGR